MAGLCEGGNEPAGSLKAICKGEGVTCSHGIRDEWGQITRDDKNLAQETAFTGCHDDARLSPGYQGLRPKNKRQESNAFTSTDVLSLPRVSEFTAERLLPRSVQERLGAPGSGYYQATRVWMEPGPIRGRDTMCRLIRNGLGLRAPGPYEAIRPRNITWVYQQAGCCGGYGAGSRVGYGDVIVLTELALFTVQIGKSSAASSVANIHGQKETKPLETSSLQVSLRASKEASLREDLEDRGSTCSGTASGRLGFDIQWNRIRMTGVRRAVEPHLEDLGSTCSVTASGRLRFDVFYNDNEEDPLIRYFTVSGNPLPDTLDQIGDKRIPSRVCI
ncbi:hypothetical protein ANN_06390 [Periplaneta americana]|uniref:Uncharacterized protein n=1 Tax=Periplaneta americana TaxID=6978 RepID=A0ABQ8TDK8_PERAM|nr:hypothetical protein ANN_06390 [Periplaneta americana]